MGAQIASMPCPAAPWPTETRMMLEKRRKPVFFATHTGDGMPQYVPRPNTSRAGPNCSTSIRLSITDNVTGAGPAPLQGPSYSARGDVFATRPKKSSGIPTPCWSAPRITRCVWAMPVTDSSMFLSNAEVGALTRKHRRDAQSRALDFMGIAHRIRPDGSIAVLRKHVERLLGGEDLTSSKPRKRTAPRLDLVA